MGIAITRYVTAWLQRRVLTATRLDKGVQDSIRTGAGYFGYILAAGFALSAAGVNFSNLAIIAGALGVGIGFGLQSIVNNFVSGLILLAERPVRVGDWVVTTAGEGIVRTINVRATEIETFDNCTIFIPNSNLDYRCSFELDTSRHRWPVLRQFRCELWSRSGYHRQDGERLDDRSSEGHAPA